ncbi:hypothetical protein Tco_0829041 [Tanacetum coccineum]
MDSMIPTGQKNTLAEYMILSGAGNRPPMLDKDLFDYWKSRMELYIQNREHERMILESVEHGPLIWPTIEENGVTRTKKYAELSPAKKIQADCDMKAINIILQGLPTDIYSLVNYHRVAKDLWEKVQLLMQGTRANTSGIGGNYSGQQRVVKCFNCQWECHMVRQYPKLKRKKDATCSGKKFYSLKLKEMISTSKAVLMANLSSYASNVLSEVPISDNTNNDMLNQSVQEMPYSEPSHFVEHPENEIHSDSNIIPYSQYLIESQNATIQDINSSAQQDALILSVFEQMSNQKAQQIRPMLYDGNVIAKETNVISIADSEETLMLEEESR